MVKETQPVLDDVQDPGTEVPPPPTDGVGVTAENEEELLREMFGEPNADGIYGAYEEGGK